MAPPQAATRRRGRCGARPPAAGAEAGRDEAEQPAARPGGAAVARSRHRETYQQPGSALGDSVASLGEGDVALAEAARRGRADERRGGRVSAGGRGLLVAQRQSTGKNREAKATINRWLAAALLVPLQPRVLLRVLRASRAAAAVLRVRGVVEVPWPAKLATRCGLGAELRPRCRAAGRAQSCARVGGSRASAGRQPRPCHCWRQRHPTLARARRA